MMKIRVRLFARARDLAGADVVDLDIPEDGCVGDVRRALSSLHPRLNALLERSALAVNDEFAEDSVKLPASAEVALLPPVSGG